jgi:radical SAM superfamily enzyme YgiQ (UPF0313 family)
MVLTVKSIIVDCLASGKGARITTRDVIGCGPRTIAGVLEKYNIETKIMPVEKFLNDKATLGLYDVLLTSGMTSDLTALQKVTKIWKQKNKNPVIIGGPVASEPIRVLRKTGADISVTGEGESTVSELLKMELDKGMMAKPQELHNVKGIAYRTGNRIEVNPFRPIQDSQVFREYPPSTIRIKDYPLYYAARVYVEILRGCSNFNRARVGPFGEMCNYCEKCTQAKLSERYDCPLGIPPGCGYCSVPSLYGPPRSRPKDLVIKEVKGLLEQGVTRLVLSAPGVLDYGRELLVQPAPLTDPRWPEPNYEVLEELLSQLTSLPKVAEGNASIMIENIKASLVTEHAVNLLGKYLYGTSVNIGFETGHPDHSCELGRPDTPSETLKAIRMLRRAGLNPYVYFIHGLPGQTEETVDATIEMINKSVGFGAERIILYRFRSLPMSAFMSFPSGSPSALEPHSKRIYEAAKRANEKSKRDLIGSCLKVVVAEQYDRDQRYLVAYPMKHGPVVLIKKNRVDKLGQVSDVEVLGVASDRIVYGKIIE